MLNEVRLITKAEDGKLSKVIEYGACTKIEMPINRDGSIRWYDDSQLLKQEG